jgi:acetate kinase
VEEGKLEEIEHMLMVNIGESSLLRRVYDQGAENEATLRILDSIESKLARRNVYFSDAQREYMATFDYDQIDQLLEMAIDGNFEDIDAFVTPALRNVAVS